MCQSNHNNKHRLDEVNKEEGSELLFCEVKLEVLENVVGVYEGKDTLGREIGGHVKLTGDTTPYLNIIHPPSLINPLVPTQVSSTYLKIW